MNIPGITPTATASTGYMQAAGMVFVMRCIPDIFTREQFNIGVCAISNNGQRKVKVITEPGRLACFYGESAVNVVLLAQAAGEAALAGAASPTQQVVFDEPTPYYNSTLDDLVNGTFADQVTAALPQRQAAGADMMDDEQALTAVSDAIKLARGLDMELLANTPQVIVNTERGPRTMRVPLQPRNGVGTVRSAYFSHTTLKNHLLDSVLDLECAARYRQKKHMGIFILRSPTASKEAVKQIDAVIDSIAFRTPKSMFLDVAYDAPALAQSIDEWAKQAN